MTTATEDFDEDEFENATFTVALSPKPYVMIHKSVLFDKRLSWSARGLFCYLLSSSSTDLKSLGSKFPEGKGSVTKLLVELEAHGYLGCTKCSIENSELTEDIYYLRPQNNGEEKLSIIL